MPTHLMVYTVRAAGAAPVLNVSERSNRSRLPALAERFAFSASARLASCQLSPLSRQRTTTTTTYYALLRTTIALSFLLVADGLARSAQNTCALKVHASTLRWAKVKY